jgi:hypothetical protein
MNPSPRRFWGLAACAALLSIFTGCASVTQGTEQPIRIETLAQAGGAAIEGAECQLSNDKGAAFAISGQSATVRRSGGNLTVRCMLDGQPPASGQAVSRANAGLAGNILIGGAIGAAIDVGTGAAFTYPTWLQLVFGEERLFDRSGHRDDGPVAGTFVRANAPESAQVVASGAVPSPASAAAPPQPVTAVGLKAPLRRGDTLEYELRDRMTGVQTPVYYRLDRIEGDQLVFNMGARTERRDGRVVSIRAPAGGLFESSAPPEGWAAADLRPGMNWRREYPKHSIEASVVGEGSVTVDGEALRVLQIDYSGWITQSTSPAAQPNYPLKATAQYSPELRRIVRFDIEVRTAGSLSRESIELRRIIRN